VPDTPGAPGDRRAQIADTARALLDAEGPQALTMRRIAAALGIKAPSLYKHVPDKTSLEALVVATGFTELAGTLAAAARTADGADKLAAIAAAYRGYALAHPHLYRLMTYQPLRRDLLPAGLEAQAAEPLAQAAGYDQARARAMWAFAHGMVSLEIDGRFPPHADLDQAWRAGLAAFTSSPAASGQTGHDQPSQSQTGRPRPDVTHDAGSPTRVRR
jgi:AcrR family transcriptional regulator